MINNSVNVNLTYNDLMKNLTYNDLQLSIQEKIRDVRMAIRLTMHLYKSAILSVFILNI